MKTCFFALVLAAVLATWFSVVYAQRTVFLVRHADRLNESEGSPLSKAGEARAQLLAGLLKDAGITAIYTSPAKTSPAKSSGRFIKTAEPLAVALKIKPDGILSTEPEGLLNRIRGENRDDIVLIVGTASSIPALLKLFGHLAEITITPTENDNLFVLVPKDNRPPTVLLLRY